MEVFGEQLDPPQHIPRLGPVKFELPKVIQSQGGAIRIAWVATKEVMNLEGMVIQGNSFEGPSSQERKGHEKKAAIYLVFGVVDHVVGEPWAGFNVGHPGPVGGVKVFVLVDLGPGFVEQVQFPEAVLGGLLCKRLLPEQAREDVQLVVFQVQCRPLGKADLWASILAAIPGGINHRI